VHAINFPYLFLNLWAYLAPLPKYLCQKLALLLIKVVSIVQI